MNAFGIIFLLTCGIAIIALPVRWAAAPLLASACCMPMGQGIKAGAFSFPILRLLIAVACIRVFIRNERPSGGYNRLDWLMLIWGAWSITSSAFHEEPSETLVYRLGFNYDALGLYFLFRIFCRTTEDIARIIKLTGLLLVPVALEMIYEHLAGHNLFSLIGDIPDSPIIRKGKLRAQGSFEVSILAGTVGAIVVPLIIGIWRKARSAAIVGLSSCIVMIIACSSSGPIMTLMAGIFALALWHWRRLTKRLLILAIVGYVLLGIFMDVPAYYILEHIDLTGSSTGWHRARLIESSIEHLNEWWFSGTDFTRHWMPTGVSWTVKHTDITNHYLKMGVLGGLPLMLLFIWVVAAAFSRIARLLRSNHSTSVDEQFMIWSLGATLFAYSVTFISITIFDQSSAFLYMLLAMIGSLSIDSVVPWETNMPGETIESVA